MVERQTEESGIICYQGYTALARHALIAWRLKIPIKRDGWQGEWRCYCAAVPGQNHDGEIESVLANGAAISRDLAEFLFKNTVEYFCNKESHDFSKLDYAS